MALTRELSRETFRDAAFLCSTVFCAARMRTGWATAKAALAASLLPEAMASSTLRRVVFICEDRALLTAVRRTAWRAAFLADLVLAIPIDLLLEKSARCEVWGSTRGAVIDRGRRERQRRRMSSPHRNLMHRAFCPGSAPTPDRRLVPYGRDRRRGRQGRSGPFPHSCVKPGLRFSTKAAIPSFWSA